MLPQLKNGISPSREGSRQRRALFHALFPCVLVLLVCSQLFGPFNPPPVSAKSRANPNPPLAAPYWLTPSTPAQPPDLGQYVTGHPNPAPVPIPHPQVKPQAPMTVRLTTSAQQVISKDGHFVLSVPAGAISSSQIQAAGGTLWLKITQTADGSGGAESGRLFLGTYQVQLQNAAGKPVTNLVLAHPFTLQYRQLAHDSLVLAQDQVVDALVKNDTATTTTSSGTTPAALPSVTSSGQPAQQAPQMLVGHKDAHAASWSVDTTLSDQTTSTGSATPNATTGQVTPAASSSTVTFSTNAPQASWGTTQNFDVGLNAGALSYSYPLSVPPGPGNFAPNLNLGYSSGSVNESHNVQAAAPWLGEGWNLSLGSITWSQENVTPGAPITGKMCGI